jgi:hypothetical protein
MRIPMTFLHFRGPPTAGFMLSAMTFDPTVALNDLLADVDLSTADAGGKVTFAGQDPIIAARHLADEFAALPQVFSVNITTGPDARARRPGEGRRAGRSLGANLRLECCPSRFMPIQLAVTAG